MSPTVTDTGHVLRSQAARRPAAALAALVGLVGCSVLGPLREPPVPAAPSALAGIETREDAIARFGSPADVRPSDVGEVLVYRRAVATQTNPNRYYGPDRGVYFDRYERLLLYVDGTGRVVRWATESE